MKTEKYLKTKSVITFLLAASVLFLGPAGGVLFAQSPDRADWPIWPEPGKRILELDVKEPATFLSIGREVVPWPFFGETTVTNDFVDLIGSHLYFTIEEFPVEIDGEIVTGYKTVKPNSSNTDILFVVSGGASFPIIELSNQEIVDSLRSRSAFPSYKEKWFSYGTEPNRVFVDNESFMADREAPQDRYIESWKSFVLEDRNIGASHFFFADSGHAPPQMVWPQDPWLLRYSSKTGYPLDSPEAWKDRHVCLWPTNQGALQVFEAFNVRKPDSTPYANRSWLIIPAPAFRQSIYHELRKNVPLGSDNKLIYKRHTLLDGPVTVRDVEIDGQWRRIAVGTTGIGTKQVPKPLNAWVRLKQSSQNPPISAPGQTTGRAFGIYAFDITELGASLEGKSPEPLWSVSNISFSHASTTYQKSFLETGSGILDIQAGNTNYGAYRDLLFSVSKPLIGYSRDLNGDKKWHVIILGVEKGSNKFKWLDIDPGNGEVIRSGYFRNSISNDDEVLTGRTVKLKGTNYVYTGENMEDLYPSRILSAFPPPLNDSEDPNDPSYYQEPLLSNVYVYLSNGGIYKWNLNPSGSTPVHLVTILNKMDSNKPLVPIADFDITYIGGDTYLAATVALTFGGGAAHDTEALLTFNENKLSSKQIIVDYSPGQAGDLIDTSDKNTMLVQLQIDQGSYTAVKKSVLASPVFVEKRLYLAFYDLDDKGKTNVSRLYSIDFLKHAGKKGNLSKANVLEELNYEEDGSAKEYYDFPKGDEAIMMFIDSKGNLALVFEKNGEMVTKTISTGLDLGSGTGSSGSDEDEKFKIVYWTTL